MRFVAPPPWLSSYSRYLTLIFHLSLQRFTSIVSFLSPPSLWPPWVINVTQPWQSFPGHQRPALGWNLVTQSGLPTLGSDLWRLFSSNGPSGCPYGPRWHRWRNFSSFHYTGTTISLASSLPGTHAWTSSAATTPASDPSTCAPWTYNANSYQMPFQHYLRERTVHTIYFKIWDPDTPNRSVYIEEIHQHGHRRDSDPEHFFHKLTRDDGLANQMSDYWRQFHGPPMKHGGTPFIPTWTPSTQVHPPPTISAAGQLATLLFGPNGLSTSRSSASSLQLTSSGTLATAPMSADQLRQFALALQSLSEHFDLREPPSYLIFCSRTLVSSEKELRLPGCVCVCVCGTSEQA